MRRQETTGSLHRGGRQFSNNSSRGSNDSISPQRPERSQTLKPVARINTMFKQTDGNSFMDRGQGQQQSDKNNISVVIRVRPMPHNYQQNVSAAEPSFFGGAQPLQIRRCIIEVKEKRTLVVPGGGQKNEPESFTFDYVGDEDCSQEEIFKVSAKPIVDQCLLGYNGTIFAYGQTGSGKTHTILGEYKYAPQSTSQSLSTSLLNAPNLNDSSGSKMQIDTLNESGLINTSSINQSLQVLQLQLDKLCGVLPRCFQYMFAQIERIKYKLSQLRAGTASVSRMGKNSLRKSNLFSGTDQSSLLPTFSEDCVKVEFDVRCQFIEIYNENLFDLLDSHKDQKLRITQDTDNKISIEGSKSEKVESLDDVMRLVTRGNNKREVEATRMNKVSSRSHAVFITTIKTIEVMESGQQNIKTSRFCIVDLAGSERSKDTGAEGKQLQEANAINKSLSVLSSVINKLAEKTKYAASETKQRSIHINYRDSKLTYLLQDSLGGNSKTVIICNVNPHLQAVRETRSTLQFAQRAKLIQNQAEINMDTNSAEYWKSKFQTLKQQYDKQQQLGNASKGVAEESKVHTNHGFRGAQNQNAVATCSSCQDRKRGLQEEQKDFQRLHSESLKVIQALTSELKEIKDQQVMDGFEKSQLAASLEQLRKSLKLNIAMQQSRTDKLRQQLLYLGDCANQDIQGHLEDLTNQFQAQHPELLQEKLVQDLLQRGNALNLINESCKQEIEAMRVQIEDQKNWLMLNPLLVMKSEQCRELEAKLIGAREQIKSLKNQLGQPQETDTYSLSNQELNQQRLGALLEDICELVAKSDHLLNSKRMNQAPGKMSIKAIKKEAAKMLQSNQNEKDSNMIDESQANLENEDYNQNLTELIDSRLEMTLNNRNISTIGGYQSEDEELKQQPLILTNSQREELDLEQRDFREYMKRRDEELANIKLMYEDQLESIRDQLKQEKKRYNRMQSLVQRSQDQLINSQITFGGGQTLTQLNDDNLASSQMTQMTYLNRNGVNLLDSQSQFTRFNSQRLQMSQLTQQNRPARAANAGGQGTTLSNSFSYSNTQVAAGQDNSNLLSSMTSDAMQTSNMMMNSSNSYNSDNTPTVRASQRDMGSDEIMSGAGSASGHRSERFEMGNGLALNQMQINTIDEGPEFELPQLDGEQPSVEMIQEYFKLMEEVNQKMKQQQEILQHTENLNKDLTNERDQLSSRLDQTHSEKISLETLKGELLDKIDQQQGHIEELQGELDGLLMVKGKVEKMEFESIDLKNQLALAQKELEELTKVNDILSGEVSSMAEEVGQLNHHLSLLQQENSDLRAIRSNNSEKDQLETEIANLRREHQSQEQHKLTLIERISNLEQTLQSKEQIEGLLKEDNRTLGQEFRLAQRQVGEMSEAHDQLMKLNEDLRLDKEQLEKELQQTTMRLEQKIDRHRTTIVLHQQKEVELKSEIQVLRNKIDEQDCESRQLQGQVNELSEKVTRLSADKMLYKNTCEKQLQQIEVLVNAASHFRKSHQDKATNNQLAIDRLTQERDQLKQKLQQGQQNFERLKKKMDKVDALTNSINNRDHELIKAVETKVELQSAKNELVLYKDRVSELEKELSRMEDELKKQKESFQALEKQRDELMSMGDKGKYSHYNKIKERNVQQQNEISALSLQLKAARNEKHQLVESVRAFGKEFSNKINLQNHQGQAQPGLLGVPRMIVNLRSDPERSVREYLNEIIQVMSENFSNLKLMLETPINPPAQKASNLDVKMSEQRNDHAQTGERPHNFNNLGQQLQQQLHKTPLNQGNLPQMQQDLRITNPFFKGGLLADNSFLNQQQQAKNNPISPSNSFYGSLNNSFANQMQAQPANQFAPSRLSAGSLGLAQHQALPSTNVQAQLQRGLQPPHHTSQAPSFRPSFPVQDSRQEQQSLPQNPPRAQAQSQQLGPNGFQSQMMIQANQRQQTQQMQQQLHQSQIQNDSRTFEEQRNRYKPMGSLDSSIDEASMIQDKSSAMKKENDNLVGNQQQQFNRQGERAQFSDKKQPNADQPLFNIGVDRSSHQQRPTNQQPPSIIAESNNSERVRIDQSARKQRMQNNFVSQGQPSQSQPLASSMGQNQLRTMSNNPASGGMTLGLKPNFNQSSQAQKIISERYPQQQQDRSNQRQPSSNSQERNMQQLQFGQRKN